MQKTRWPIRSSSVCRIFPGARLSARHRANALTKPYTRSAALSRTAPPSELACSLSNVATTPTPRRASLSGDPRGGDAAAGPDSRGGGRRVNPGAGVLAVEVPFRPFERLPITPFIIVNNLGHDGRRAGDRRRHVDRTPAVVKMDSLAPTRPAAAALENVCDVDLDTLDVELPSGFGRD